MKPEELFIGAIVSNTNGNVGKVIGIAPYNQAPPDVIMGYNGGTCFSDPKMLQPIAITPAILEKNGWFTKDEAIWFKKDTVRMGWYKKNCEFIAGYHTMPFAVEFVHQLQHVIRLLGMEENLIL